MFSTRTLLQDWLNKPLNRFVASALSGVLLAACFPLVDWSALVWVACLPLLIAVIAEKRPTYGFLLGYISGAVFLGGSCYWFVGVMEHYGRLDTYVTASVFALFLIVFSTFYGVFGLIETFVARRSVRAACFLGPFLWVALELARTYLITGFPWNLLGYSVRPVGLEQLASVTAVYGLSFLAVATSALLAWSLLGSCRGRVAWSISFVWVGALIVGNTLLLPLPRQPQSNLAVLVQPNISLAESALRDWAPWLSPERLDRLIQQSVAATRESDAKSAFPPLLVWPENPAPFYFDRDPVFRDAVENMAREAHAYVIAGAVTFGGPGTLKPRNAAIVLAPDGRLVLQYDKIHLVPFGEYVPWWAFPGKVGKITSQAGDFVPGTSLGVARTAEGTIGVFICYEAIFPQLVRKIARSGAEVLVNLSDDAWYGDSSAPYQHFEMARFRAIENGRFLLRATNNGITAIVDPYGRVQKEIPRHERSVLTGDFTYRSTQTLYTKYGDVFAWICVAVAAGLILTVVLRQTPS